ncbi:hypothetical protein PEDI_53970 [Persicobacter diffluens]|uniref:Resolvase/invertase-type recombinase catalytic domain-containing protein n=1 Tax=Persicobacter diffluens TaxID=981 RepID=A0AAN4W5C8_9BACT|nr:hypothetical protein PEDI_53970 [Persicobacter diffluens]
MKAVIYTRVSTKEQSTTRQVAELKNVPDFEVVECHQDYKSTIITTTSSANIIW